MAAEAHLSLVSSLSECLAYAVVKVVVEQVQRHGPQSTAGCTDLGENVDAVFVVVDHLRDAANLALDSTQSLGVGVLVRCISVFGLHLTSHHFVIESFSALPRGDELASHQRHLRMPKYPTGVHDVDYLAIVGEGLAAVSPADSA
jgi:hypothetical protein